MSEDLDKNYKWNSTFFTN